MLHKVCHKFIQLIHILYLLVRYNNRLYINEKKGINFDTKISIQQKGIVKIERLSTFSNVHISTVGGEIIIGRNVFMNRYCMIMARKKIVIGDGCMFGPNVVIYDHDHVFGKNGIDHELYKTDEVVIEDGCWIGAGAIILRGSHIGEGSVIGAGTVVKGEIPAHSIVKTTRELQISKLDR